MEDTCRYETCVIAKKFRLKERQGCPNFIEVVFKDDETGQTKLVGDCAPVRTLLMIQDMFNRLICVQKNQDKQKNKVEPIFELIRLSMEAKELENKSASEI